VDAGRGAHEKLGSDRAIGKILVGRAVLHAHFDRIGKGADLSCAEEAGHDPHFAVAGVVLLRARWDVHLYAERGGNGLAVLAEQTQIGADTQVAEAGIGRRVGRGADLAIRPFLNDRNGKVEREPQAFGEDDPAPDVEEKLVLDERALRTIWLVKDERFVCPISYDAEREPSSACKSVTRA
jgi:hypothetical protein